MDDNKPYVYVIRDGVTPLYVGKGTGRRCKDSARKHGGDPHILEVCEDDDHAFERERHWIKELRPTNNISLGGGGGRSSMDKSGDMPRSIRGQVTPAQWRAAKSDYAKTIREIEEVGSRVYCARYLLTKIDDRNCEQYGVSEVGISRLREVAHG